MKKMNNQKRLVLNKETITGLNSEMNQIMGGVEVSYNCTAQRICKPYNTSICIKDTAGCTLYPCTDTLYPCY